MQVVAVGEGRSQEAVKWVHVRWGCNCRCPLKPAEAVEVKWETHQLCEAVIDMLRLAPTSVQAKVFSRRLVLEWRRGGGEGAGDAGELGDRCEFPDLRR